MAPYQVTLAKSAEKELLSLDAPLVRRIYARIEALAVVPRPPGCKKLEGGPREWRIRIGDYRVIYTIDDRRRMVDVSAVREPARRISLRTYMTPPLCDLHSQEVGRHRLAGKSGASATTHRAAASGCRRAIDDWR